MRQSFRNFIEKVEAYGKKRKPLKKDGEVSSRSLFAMRNKRLSIREAALRGVSCLILYKKATTNEINRYEVIPTEYAYRRTKAGRLNKVLWVQDLRERPRLQIKCFYVRNIMRAIPTKRKVEGKWPVLIR